MVSWITINRLQVYRTRAATGERMVAKRSQSVQTPRACTDGNAIEELSMVMPQRSGTYC